MEVGELQPDCLASCGLKTSILGTADQDHFQALTVFPPQSSSICRAAIHYGILDNKGGLVDITRNGRVPFFVKSERNGMESLR